MFKFTSALLLCVAAVCTANKANSVADMGRSILVEARARADGDKMMVVMDSVYARQQELEKTLNRFVTARAFTVALDEQMEKYGNAHSQSANDLNNIRAPLEGLLHGLDKNERVILLKNLDAFVGKVQDLKQIIEQEFSNEANAKHGNKKNGNQNNVNGNQKNGNGNNKNANANQQNDNANQKNDNANQKNTNVNKKNEN